MRSRKERRDHCLIYILQSLSLSLPFPLLQSNPRNSLFLSRPTDEYLPCAMCLVESEGMPSDQWRSAVMREDHLQTQMQHRMRQHFQRKHDLCMRSKDGAAMKELGKRLLCSCLHQSDSTLTAEVSVSSWLLSSYLCFSSIALLC